MTGLLKFNQPATYDAAIGSGANSLANGSSVLSSAIANGTDYLPFGDFSLILASLNPTGSPFVEIHICPLLDDATNYADLSDATWIGNINIKTGSAAKYAMLKGMDLIPGDFKVGLKNASNVSFGASGNTLKLRRYALNNNA